MKLTGRSVTLVFLLCAVSVELNHLVSGKIVTATETRNCIGVEYHYGVVSSELVCPPDLAKNGTCTECTRSATNALCRDGVDDRYYRCDPMVDVYRAADYYNKSITKENYLHAQYQYFPVQWLLQDEKDPATYYRLRKSTFVQYIYRVRDVGVSPRHCASLVARVRDRDGWRWDKDGYVWGKMRYTEYAEIMPYWYNTKFPLPGEHGVKVGDFFIYSHLYNTNTRVKIKVNYLLRYQAVRFEGENVTHWGGFTPFTDALNVLKEDLALTPVKIQIGIHELHCYFRKFRAKCAALRCEEGCGLD